MRSRPRWLNIEVTKRCNAKCNFCGYWEERSPPEIDDYTAAVKLFRPVVLSLSGGEPLLRRDLHEMIKRLRPYCHYAAVVTNGTLLTEERARELFDSGVDQLSVSLDFIDDTHDKMRGVPGLFAKITKIVPDLAAKGFNMAFNTVIMETNLDHIVPLAKKAHEWGVGISFSTYCPHKNDNHDHVMSPENYEKLVSVVHEIKELKRANRNVKNSDYYLGRIPEFVMNNGIPDCKAGVRWVQVTPDGYLQPCSELPRYCHFTEYSRKNIPVIKCTKCWYACRGEAEANPVEPKRLIELAKS
jgi:MoaA/NifB/PqqE/SkfB family radical SAM enzyme